MKKLLTVLVALGLLTLSSPLAFASPVNWGCPANGANGDAPAMMCISGFAPGPNGPIEIHVPVPLFELTPGLWGVNPNRPEGGFSFSNPIFGDIVVDATLKQDPFISYSIQVTNPTGGTVDYKFQYFQTLIPPIGPNNEVYGEVQGTFRAGETVLPNTIGFTALNGDPDGDGINEAAVFSLSTDNVNFTNMGVDVGPSSIINSAVPPPGKSFPYGLYTEGLESGPVPGSNWNSMLGDVSFRLTGGGDTVQLSGLGYISQVEVVPEPGSLLLLGSGLIGMGAVVSWRRRHSR